MGSEDVIAKSCCICLSDEMVKKEAFMYPCGHTFHGDCIMYYRGSTKKESVKNCPTCRQYVADHEIIR